MFTSTKFERICTLIRNAGELNTIKRLGLKTDDERSYLKFVDFLKGKPGA